MTKQPGSDTRPPYRRVADVLREEIGRGVLRPGQQLPSHRELQERFEIANMTARSALRVLREEGLIYTVQGRGSYVLGQDPETGEADEFKIDYTPPAWYTASLKEKRPGKGPDHQTGKPAAPRSGESAPTDTAEAVEGLDKAFRASEPGALEWPNASPEFNALAQQVHALSARVDQLTQLFEQILKSGQRPEA
ncbi:GntR family transcriptional regulator [Streptomyces sp. NPDC006692]|uniref:GntR family transcriptional regulator n=1 Tax=Streptomyces sp. NPDC006692 TaxID=3364758 RepID=UPI0036803C30